MIFARRFIRRKIDRAELFVSVVNAPAEHSVRLRGHDVFAVPIQAVTRHAQFVPAGDVGFDARHVEAEVGVFMPKETDGRGLRFVVADLRKRRRWLASVFGDEGFVALHADKSDGLFAAHRLRDGTFARNPPGLGRLSQGR